MSVFIGPNSGTPESTHHSAWVKISTTTGSSAISTLTFDGLDTSVYRAWMLIGGFFPAVDDAYLNFYWRRSGSDEVDNKYAYANNITYPTNQNYQSSAQNQGRMQILENAGNDTSNREGHRFQITMFPYRTGDAVNLGNFCYWSAIRIDNDGDFRGYTGQGSYDKGGVSSDGFRLQMSSGNISHYNYSLYGLLV